MTRFLTQRFTLRLKNTEPSDARVPHFSTVEASLESQRRLVVPITIVTAASANHVCALEAFLYHLNGVLNKLDTSPVKEVSRRVAREQRAIQYVDTSPDMAVIRGRAKKKTPAAHQKSRESHGLQGAKNEKRQDGSGAGGHSSIVYEIRPKVVVYNMGMGPTKRKRRTFRALVEAGFMDEVYDFDFDRYPAFWALGTETRGEYAWKAGIIDEVSQRLLGTQPSSGSLFENRDMGHYMKPRKELIDNETIKMVQEVLEVVELQSSEARDSQGYEGTLSEEDNEALDELEEQEVEQEEEEEEETEQGVQEQDTIEQQPQQGIPQGQQPQQTNTSTEMTTSEPTQKPSSSPSSPPTPHEPSIVLWLDSGDRISVEFLRWLPSFMLRHGLWTPQSQDTLWTWTHPGMLAYFHDTLDRFPPNETNCNGAALALDVRNVTVRDGILREWVDCAKTKECIAPEGSSRANHRQDQAALTYLVKTMGYTDVCVGFPEVYGVQINQDKFCKEDIAENVDRVVPRI